MAARKASRLDLESVNVSVHPRHYFLEVILGINNSSKLPCRMADGGDTRGLKMEDGGSWLKLLPLGRPTRASLVQSITYQLLQGCLNSGSKF